MEIPTKWKYRCPKPTNKRATYRARTGPHCCNAGCGRKMPKWKYRRR